MFARIDRRLEMGWAKVRGRGQNHNVNVTLDHFAIRIKADEPSFGWNVDAILESLV